MSILLALGGGGALGWAHIGVIRLLEREGIAVAGIAGASMGALVGACHAAGGLDRLEEVARGLTHWRTLRYLGLGYGRGAAVSGRAVERELSTVLGETRLEALPVPMLAVTADLVSGERVDLHEGPALPAVMASIAIPGLLPPVRMGGRLLADGGMLCPVPAGPVRRLARRPVVAVNVIADYPSRALSLGVSAAGRRPPTAWRTMWAGAGLAIGALGRLSLAADPPDLLIEPRVGHVSAGSFWRADELIAEGRRAAEAALPAIRELAGR